VHARALVAAGDGLAVVDDLGARALVGRALGDQQAVLELHRDTVVRARRLVGVLDLGRLLGVEDLRGAGSIAPQHGLAVVDRDVARLGRRERLAEPRLAVGQVVRVVAVRLDLDPGVEQLEALGLGRHEHVPLVAGVVDSQEAVHREVGDGLEGVSLEDADSPVVRHHEPRPGELAGRLVVGRGVDGVAVAAATAACCRAESQRGDDGRRGHPRSSYQSHGSRFPYRE
jgi:hypothetical protein